MNQNDKKTIFLVIFMILGLILSIQFKSTLYTNNQRSAAMLSMERLIESINTEKGIQNDLRADIENNVQDRENSINAYIESRNDDKLKKEWDSIRLKAGLTDVKGSGLVIKLDDAPARQEDEDPSLLIIHDMDILVIINELKKAGAQAISINDERIVSMSEQICGGPTILINKNRYPVPYVVKAIGDPDKLYEAIIRSERVNMMIEDKIRVEVKRTKEVLIPGYGHNPANMITGLEVVKK